MEFFDNLFTEYDGITLILIIFAIVLVWFLPALLALIFNRKHVKYIFLACIPAGLSFIAWGAVLVWAVGGKAAGKYADKFKQTKS